MARGISAWIGLLTLLMSPVAPNAGPQGEQSNPPWLEYGQKALDEYRAKNYPAFLENAEKAVRTGPRRHPWLAYNLARAYALNGKGEEAWRLLAELAGAGIGVDAAENEDFKSLRAAAGWAELMKKIGAARAPLVRSRTAFVIPERDLFPEGIAYDPKGRTFYVGSTHKSKILAVDSAGRARDFKAGGQDGLSEVLGMRADARRRLLWVCSNRRGGAGSVFKYDLDTGRLLKRYTLDERPARHLLNDIAFNERGDAYVTDSLGAAVYEIPAAADELRLLVRLERGAYPNGIAVSGGGRRLYVASFTGISLIDPVTKKVEELAGGEGGMTTGVDGLYLHADGLVAVQNANPSPDRVVRLSLSRDGRRVEKARVIESNHPLHALPTTGVVVGDDFYYFANTQIDRMGRDGQVPPAAELKDVTVLRAKLK